MAQRRRTPRWGIDPKLERAKQKAQEQKALSERHLATATRPDEYDSPPTLPDDPSDWSDNRLIEEMTLFTKWVDFLEVEHAAAEIEERGYEGIIEVMEAQGLIRNWDEGSVTVAKARRDVADDLRDARDLYQVAYARRKMIATMLHRAERGAALLSRELTRRLDSDPPRRRSDRYTT